MADKYVPNREGLENPSSGYNMICSCAEFCKDATDKETFYSYCIDGGQDCLRKPLELEEKLIGVMN